MKKPVKKHPAKLRILVALREMEDRVRKMASDEERSVNQQVRRLVRLGLAKIEEDKKK